MNQQRNDHAQGARISSQSSRDDEEICSNKATSGSSDSGSDNLGLALTRSRSSERGIQRSPTMRHQHDQQACQTKGPDATPGASSHDSSPFIMGLTLTPLPSAMLPMKKRPLNELLEDRTPPEKDKMSAEIDQLASETPSKTRDITPDEPPRRKRSKTNEGSTSQALPIIMRDSTTNSNRRGRAPLERRSEHNASHRGSRPTSD
ncbi:hypothetical protein FHL15_002120 [Xylaria flabelliformis]|uniref:Uncharacterized protein n=1 Tax=Xylaria flabelliformis TaxID=2512241 RepID=A0A553I9C9_9PEZI|nr:hypothetical protein FHL15_002120 [Xylaria flabelliformis]